MSQVPGLGHVTFYRHLGRYPTLFHFSHTLSLSLSLALFDPPQVLQQLVKQLVKHASSNKLSDRVVYYSGESEG